MLSSQIYHLVWVFNLLSPFVLNIKNHLIESPKSIFLHFSLAYCCPFWFIAHNDSLVPGISKYVFCRVDYVSKNSSFYPPVIEKKKEKKKAFPLQESLLAFTLHASPAAFDWNADSAPALPWLGHFPPKALPRGASKHRWSGQFCGRMHPSTLKILHSVWPRSCPICFFGSFLKQYSLTALFMSGNGTYTI